MRLFSLHIDNNFAGFVTKKVAILAKNILESKNGKLIIGTWVPFSAQKTIERHNNVTIVTYNTICTDFWQNMLDYNTIFSVFG